MPTDTLFLLLGLVLLIAGGDLLVRGAVRIAERLRLSPMLIGLTVVGMGTSTPELAASLQASLAGSPGIALGNIVGSNFANALLILGTAALIAPIAVNARTLWRDGGVGVVAALALLGAGATVGLSREAGLGFLILMVGYVYYAYRQESVGAAHSAAYDRAAAMEEVDPALIPRDQPAGRLSAALLLFTVGLALIVGGGSLLVNAAIAIAQKLGVSDTVIGLTIVAVGTSLPELVTSAVAAWRRQGDIALGNVLGSNIYNILFIGGLTGAIAPTTIPASIMAFDLWALVAVSLVVLLFAFSGGRLSRREGLVLVAAYIVYAGYTAGLI
ncbi:calcium/sodium antiporter [Brevundimonas sp. S30B]|uniref:calcium/sodium antiporter n=1 Tax=unclassified Brevundimonas TaxID=2622653 RepID=UPI0010716720|nr:MULTISPECIES: calcium/sodium antiporter [unclassified Brevundimonas]QBX37447.1 calcium/sodium antiporter [Brevundimonas sp. MF30-B]TFW03760.1 calcium/sodium antiporter [Brevundimonas sp. S30B]